MTSMNSDPNSPSMSGPAPPDFLLEFYKLHRAHEVALNNATGAYEQSALRLVLVLNAAAIAAFLALMEAAGGDRPSLGYDYGLAMIAIDWWAAGVACAFIATIAGYFSQRSFTAAYKFRRQAIELFRAKNGNGPLDLYGIQEDCYACKANSQREFGKRFQNAVYLFGCLAVLTSAIGFWKAKESVHPNTTSSAIIHEMTGERRPHP